MASFDDAACAKDAGEVCTVSALTVDGVMSKDDKRKFAKVTKAIRTVCLKAEFAEKHNHLVLKLVKSQQFYNAGDWLDLALTYKEVCREDVKFLL